MSIITLDNRCESTSNTDGTQLYWVSAQTRDVISYCAHTVSRDDPQTTAVSAGDSHSALCRYNTEIYT